MKYLPLRAWFLVTITPVFVAVIIRIVWEVIVDPSVDGLVMSILATLVLLCLFALIFYFTIKPDLKMLKNLPFGVGIALAATGGFISGVIHFVHFVPSPEAEAPLSLVLAILFLFAGASAYFMLLWMIWSFWTSRKNQG
jgi:hypothetical protein